MERSLYRVGSGEMCYYDVYDDDGQYHGYYMFSTDDMLLCLVDELLDDMMDNN